MRKHLLRNIGKPFVCILVAGTAVPISAHGQDVIDKSASSTSTNPVSGISELKLPVRPARTIRSLRVLGAQRIEPDTVLSYTKLGVGEPYTNESVDAAIKDLYASDLIAEAQIEGVESGDLIVRIRENPVINRVVLEGNRRLKSDKILPEIKLAPRQIFTRTAVRADVGRIVELYRRQGRFAAVVEPKQVVLDQNRVDVVFEIAEGPKSKVRQINILGNEQFSDNALRKEMATKQARFFRFFSSATSYDQDRLAYDQQKLRQYYLTEGYADFRVISAVAELTPDKEDFIITYVVEEGPRYKFGDVTVDSGIRDFNGEQLAKSLQIKKGEWFNAKLVEDSVTSLSEAAGLFGYAFADVRPEYQRDEETLTMGLTFNIAESQRTYVERIEITGNTQTQDEVIRREMRIAEGDAYNSFLRKRSQDRINSLGYFQDKFEIEEQPGSTPDRVILTSNVEERSTGELSLSAGFSSVEQFILQASIRQRNFRGKGQDLRLSGSYSIYSKSLELGFTEPYLLDKNIALGGTIFRRDYNNFNYVGDERNTTYSQVSTGFNIVAGIPLTEYWSLSGRYTLQQDDVSLDESTYFSNGSCDPLLAGRYLCEQLGERLTSSIGLSLVYDSLNSRLRPTDGERLLLGLDFAGIGGDVRYVRARFDGTKYFNMGSGFVLSTAAQGGYIKALEESAGPGIDPVRIIDRFYLGEPQFRGFDIRGVGPRVQRIPFTTDDDGNTILVTDRDQISDDALGGNAYYLAKAEIEIPLGTGAAELGLRPSIYVMAGALFSVTQPLPTVNFTQATDESGNPVFNVDGSPSLQSLVTPVTTDAGAALYLNSFTGTDGVAGTRYTTCSTGYADAYGGTCSGSDQNGAVVNTTTPFVERFLGNSAKPRITVGIGVNWNSPFGPLRIDLAKDLISVDGDDPKLLTFNVGAGF
ncbi:outer membrane protein assembly factor BamA [Sphingomonas qomolangmaensis]|uniref:Outer membrane protein assembly factor BamA n=1 Tax=Sphingomonas qomolangmaensis TaxID=2918765 RepID=A0ABY5L864_9SPHN|nr:outer membrane protein assembly factor BamA [Sphingomonas qomolangmaensis]UUL83165.1 outer membrane protein assembly factor BamA [Sphingomonas qomolangmaensis]